jgi:creatinine amidohydrolase
MTMAENLLWGMTSDHLGEPNETFDKAAIVIGSIESHGRVLPYSSDALMSWAVATRVADRVPGLLVLPLMPYGVSLHHVGLYGTISLQPNTLVEVLLDVMRSLSRHGLKRFWFVSNHDGNPGPLEAAARQIRDEDPEVVVACQVQWWLASTGVMPENLFESVAGTWGGHGGEAETSLLLHTNPELVRLEQARDFGWPFDDLPNGGLLYWNFNELTHEGSVGDPRRATAEKGERLLNAIVDHSVHFLTQLDAADWKYGVKVT